MDAGHWECKGRVPYNIWDSNTDVEIGKSDLV